MSKSTQTISVLSANRLGDGVVVFLGYEGDWTESITGAAVARAPDEARALEARGAHDAARNLVVEPYLVEVREVAGRVIPIRYRERVRVAGPSILDDVPGYAEPAVVRQAHHGDGDQGQPETGDRGPQTLHRPEPVEGRAAHLTHAQAA